MKYDIVFLHAGGFNPEGLQGPYFPIGVIGLASLLDQNGFRVKIVNAFLERILRPDLNANAIVRNYPAKVYGIDLHWFVHAYESIKMTQIIKTEMPDSKVVTGGLTASHYDAEILENFKCIDAVIRGDAEHPLLLYVRSIIESSDITMNSIPNLSYRDRFGAVVRNPLSYTISQKELNRIDFMRFDLAVHWEKGLNLLNLDYVPIKEIKRTASIDDYYEEDVPMKATVLYTGRDAPTAAASAVAPQRHLNRHSAGKLLLRSPESIAEDVIRFTQLPVDLLYIPHNPFITASLFQHRFMDEIESRIGSASGAGGNRRLPLGFIFEDCPFHIDFEIIGRYLRLFDPGKSIVRLYVADVEPGVSRMNHFPVDLEKILHLIEVLDGRVYCMLGAMIGLPGQTRESTLKMAQFLQEAKRRNAQVLIYNAELHPGSELMQRPEHYQVSIELSTFMDYYTFLRHKRDKRMTYGYQTSNDISIEEQRDILERSIK